MQQISFKIPHVVVEHLDKADMTTCLAASKALTMSMGLMKTDTHPDYSVYTKLVNILPCGIRRKAL